MVAYCRAALRSAGLTDWAAASGARARPAARRRASLVRGIGWAPWPRMVGPGFRYLDTARGRLCACGLAFSAVTGRGPAGEEGEEPKKQEGQGQAEDGAHNPAGDPTEPAAHAAEEEAGQDAAGAAPFAGLAPDPGAATEAGEMGDGDGHRGDCAEAVEGEDADGQEGEATGGERVVVGARDREGVVDVPVVPAGE